MIGLMLYCITTISRPVFSILVQIFTDCVNLYVAATNILSVCFPCDHLDITIFCNFLLVHAENT